MNLSLLKSNVNLKSEIKVTGSKSESNRLLLLQALFSDIEINNISNSDDAVVMQKGLKSQTNVIDIHHAGTAMRFLTAFFATQEGREVLLTGSERMQERPIKTLVDALKQLGARITYEKNEGFPPLRIHGQKLIMNKVSIDANVSSQYISALLLIAPKLKDGLELHLNGSITSIPYIKMTLSLLNQIGVKTSFIKNTIKVEQKKSPILISSLTVESDWSSASYFYSIVALGPIGTQIELSSYKPNSLQGDAVLSQIYMQFGVSTTFKANTMCLKKESQIEVNSIVELDLVNAPDIAQTIAVTCVGLNVPCKLFGLHTLKIKETDRLVALKTEIEKFGTMVNITDESLEILKFSPFNSQVAIDTYNDHRMAMAFAPLALKTGFQINDAKVVSKSFPDFWNDLKAIGFRIN
ncbi:MAG: 3-phosphoshikimate 1-carboxyvinyltransferase [Flavobacteriaceae bacterium]|nr:3-phosphoshikimate 1-carboxyvinyltransferase [Flavobacteriaceae bacterium]